MTSWLGLSGRYAGRLAGALIGLWLAGAAGVALGAALGWWRDDRRYFAPLRPGRWRQWSEDPRERVFLAALFGWAGHIAKRDGRVSEAEIAATRALMNEFGLDSAARRVAISQFSAAKQPGYPWRRYLIRLRRVRGGRPAQRWLRLLLGVALADGEPTGPVFRRLRDAVRLLRIDDEDYRRLYASVRRRAQGSGDRMDVAWAYAVLGLEEGATAETVRIAYRRLLSRHHPDRLVARGADEATLREAGARTREVKAAYDYLRRRAAS
ncbi:Co-chaperone protein DjlA [wastewater metagenome]|uniref:Co-chaperone protein DjlA n=2 Tax=unclassified sequences TaxID=12908 RepID=A0A5B8RFA1_9ZZZZ|nr:MULTISPECIES: TerB family tellurite resistance protein [Arhodomonas]MCS4502874.1 TerB family tellurite resistance protein [Arhodomonas aquaeolei]QEA06528.1 co-chaperone protein DjlA [uncultured organism]